MELEFVKRIHQLDAGEVEDPSDSFLMLDRVGWGVARKVTPQQLVAETGTVMVVDTVADLAAIDPLDGQLLSFSRFPGRDPFAIVNSPGASGGSGTPAASAAAGFSPAARSRKPNGVL